MARLMALAFAVVVGGCGGEVGTGLVGRWRNHLRHTTRALSQWEFKGDGSFRYEGYFGSQEQLTGSYTVSGQNLILDGRSTEFRTDMHAEWSHLLRGDRLVIYAALPAAPPPQGGTGGAVGVWAARHQETWLNRGFRVERTERLELRADGTLTDELSEDGQLKETRTGSYLRFGAEEVQLSRLSASAPPGTPPSIDLYLLVEGVALALDENVYARE